MIQSILAFLSEFSHIFMWLSLLFVIIILIILWFLFIPRSNIMVAFEYLYEKVYYFYEEILGKEEKSSVKWYVVTLFFVILFANLCGVMIDFIAPIFWSTSEGGFLLSSYIILPTASLEFTLALSWFSIFLMLFLQGQSLGFKKFFLNYIPLTGKKYFVLHQGKLPAWKFFILAPLVKIADMLLSLFLAFLDILWLFAKVISLAFRLFWNMTSGTVLLGMVIIGTSSISSQFTQFLGGVEFPIIFPIIVVLQGLLVATIQAMVFSLLVAIFIRIAQMQRNA